MVNISPSYVQNIGKGFYRGVVVDVLQSDVIVLLVDFCKIIKTKLTNLRQITAQFKEEPAFVRICDLYGIKIKNWTDKNIFDPSSSLNTPLLGNYVYRHSLE